MPETRPRGNLPISGADRRMLWKIRWQRRTGALFTCPIVREGKAQCNGSEYEGIVNEEMQEKEKCSMLEKMIKDAITEVSSRSVGSMYSMYSSS